MPTSHVPTKRIAQVLVCLTALLAISRGRIAFAGPVELLLTADTEGHIAPCEMCPSHKGLGGLARRSTLLSQLRSDRSSPVLLLDAGNALFGEESLDSEGRVIVAAYNALQYDAVNLSYRDFRLGRRRTLEALREAKFSVVSANLVDAITSKPLFDPFVVKQIGGGKIAVMGLTESPAALAYLPRLREQLAGVKVRPPADALAEWLPKAKAESDQVVLLYYGSAAGLAPIRERFGNDLAAILVGGMRPGELPDSGKPLLVAVEEHGKTVARARIGAAGVQEIAVAPSLSPDAAMRKLLEQTGYR